MSVIDSPEFSDRKAYVKPSVGKSLALPPPLPKSICCLRIYCDARLYPDGNVFHIGRRNPWCHLIGHRWSR
jgi:hypothetical protein